MRAYIRAQCTIGRGGSTRFRVGRDVTLWRLYFFTHTNSCRTDEGIGLRFFCVPASRVGDFKEGATISASSIAWISRNPLKIWAEKITPELLVTDTWLRGFKELRNYEALDCCDNLVGPRSALSHLRQFVAGMTEKKADSIWLFYGKVVPLPQNYQQLI